MTDERTHYEVLGIGEDATNEEIQKVYRAIQRAHHPDVSPGPESEEISILANIAKDILLDFDKRAEYDRSLHSPAEDEWTEPTWGEEANWGGEEVGGDVIEDDSSFGDDDFSFGDEHDETDYESIKNLPPPEIPESAVNDPVTVKTRLWDALLALSIVLIAPVAGGLAQSDAGTIELVGLVAAFLGSIVIFFAARGWEFTWMWTAPRQIGAFISAYAILYLGSDAVPTDDFIGAIFPIAFSIIISGLVSHTFWGYMAERKIIKPKSLKKSNSFGGLGGSILEELIEESINSLWRAKGLRVFRVGDPSFTHILVYGNRVALLKGAHLSAPGSLKWSGPVLLNRFGEGQYEKILDESYNTYLVNFLTMLPKGVKVFPFVATFPMNYFISSGNDNGRTTLVAGEDLAALVANVLFDGQEPNVVNHELITKLIDAVNS